MLISNQAGEDASNRQRASSTSSSAGKRRMRGGRRFAEWKTGSSAVLKTRLISSETFPISVFRFSQKPPFLRQIISHYKNIMLNEKNEKFNNSRLFNIYFCRQVFLN
jgi:hypothetical protein